MERRIWHDTRSMKEETNRLCRLICVYSLPLQIWFLRKDMHGDLPPITDTGNENSTVVILISSSRFGEVTRENALFHLYWCSYGCTTKDHDLSCRATTALLSNSSKIDHRRQDWSSVATRDGRSEELSHVCVCIIIWQSETKQKNPNRIPTARQCPPYETNQSLQERHGKWATTSFSSSLFL